MKSLKDISILVFLWLLWVVLSAQASQGYAPLTPDPVYYARIEFVGQNNVNQTSWTAGLLQGTTFSNMPGLVVNSSSFTLPSGIYELTTDVSYTIIGARRNINLRYDIDNTTQYTHFGGSYTRNTQGNNTAGDSFTELVELVATSDIAIEFQREAAGNNTQVALEPAASRLIIKKLQ